MLLEIVISLFLLFLFFLVVLIVRWKVAYRQLKRYGIDGPPAELFFGNVKQIWKLGIHQFLETNIRKYGSIFGFYCGIQPYIVVKDLEALKQIMVKQFENFTDREHAPEMFMSPSKETGLFSSRGSDWKRQRKILSKSFNTINLSKMSPLVEKCCHSLAEKIEEHSISGKSFNIHKLCGLYTMEVILAAGFGHKIDVLNGQADGLTETVSSFLAMLSVGEYDQKFIATLCSNFPFLVKIMRMMVVRSEAYPKFMYIESKTRDLVAERLRSGHPDGDYQDLLQILVDAKADSDDETAEEIVKDPYRNRLTNTEVVKTSLEFIIAGYETTNNTLAYTSYLLALYPEEQEKVFEEIDSFFSQWPEATLYEAARNLNYVDMVIQESLRLYPPAPTVSTRQTLHTTVINGQVFPEGTVVFVPVMAIHYSPDIWPEPSIFRPNRFSKVEKEKRHPMAHMPFGWGPRSCIGMRLALMETKMALIGIMKNYKFVEAPDTEKPLTLSVGISMVPKNGIYLKVEQRI